MKMVEIICQKNAHFFMKRWLKESLSCKAGTLSVVYQLINPFRYPLSCSHCSLNIPFDADYNNVSFTAASRKKWEWQGKPHGFIILGDHHCKRAFDAVNGCSHDFLPPLFLVNDSPAPVFKCCHIAAVVPYRGVPSHKKGGIIHFPVSGIDSYGGIGHQDKCRERIWV